MKAVKRMNAARVFPVNTCPASRHVAMMAEALAKGKPYPMFTDDPRHCSESLAATVAALWEARTLLQRAGYEWDGDTWAKAVPA